MITPMTAPATLRAAKSSGSRPARFATAAAITSMVRVNSSTARARTSGTAMLSSMVSCSRASSSELSPASIALVAPRIAAIGPSPAGCASSAWTVRTSISSCRTTSSLVGK